MKFDDLDAWFVREVLPLEAALLRFLRRNRRGQDDIGDLLQDVYVRIYESASSARPEQVQAFAFAIARHLLIDLARRAQIVSIETFADLDMLDNTSDELTPERKVSSQQELRLLQSAVDGLPARCREVLRLRKIDGLSQREVAAHMGISENTVEKHIAKGMQVLTDVLLLKGVVVGMSTLAKKVRRKGGLQ